MTIKTMILLVLSIATVGVVASIVSAVLAVTAVPVEGGDTYRTHMMASLAACLLVTAAHLFFLFFFVAAGKALAATGQAPTDQGEVGKGSEAARRLRAGALSAAAAVTVSLLVVIIGVRALTSTGAEGPHRWLSWVFLAVQCVTLGFEWRAGRCVSDAEAEARRLTSALEEAGAAP